MVCKKQTDKHTNAAEVPTHATGVSVCKNVTTVCQPHSTVLHADYIAIHHQSSIISHQCALTQTQVRFNFPPQSANSDHADGGVTDGGLVSRLLSGVRRNGRQQCESSVT